MESPSDAIARGGSAVPEMWDYHGSGLLLPRGTVVTSELTEGERLALEAASARRGVESHKHKHVRRSVTQERILEALCEYVDSFGVDVFGAITFSDSYAGPHFINSLDRALEDVRRGLREMPMNHGKRRGLRGRFALAGEWHRTGRLVPHVHFLLSADGEPLKAVCSEVFSYFKSTRGRVRVEPVLDLGAGTRYALKDVLKETVEHPEAMLLCTTRPRRVQHS